MTKFFYSILSFVFFMSGSFFTSLILLYPQTTAWAADADEEVFINADHMHLSINSGRSIFTGNVKISQGQVILTGDKIIVQQNNNVIERITILGKPARYNNTTVESEPITAESKRMVYDISNNILVLINNAILKQPDHSVSSQRIIYNTKKRLIIAGDKNSSKKSSSSTGNNRVKITLTPKKPVSPK